jgi:hypothetical protein
MIRRLSTYLFEKVTYPVAVFLTVIMFLYASLVMGSQSACITDQMGESVSLLGLKFAYDYSLVSDLFSSLDEESLRCYLRLIGIWDNLFPLLYASMYISWLSIIFRKVHSIKRFLINLYPVVPPILDWMENFMEFRLVHIYLSGEGIDAGMVEWASLITSIKWSASSLNYLLILSGLLIWMYRGYQRRRKLKDS